MKKLSFDTGLQSYKLGAGVLRFNPADPNVYVRFSQATEKLQTIEQDMTQALSRKGADVLAVMAETDKALKDTLGWVFGPGNDFDQMLGGVNLLAVAADGKRVANHLFAALEPVLLEGAKLCAQAQAKALQSHE